MSGDRWWWSGLTCPLCKANWWSIDVAFSSSDSKLHCSCHLCKHKWEEEKSAIPITQGVMIRDNQEYHSEDGVLGCTLQGEKHD